jgi:hypothetical protein
MCPPLGLSRYLSAEPRAIQSYESDGAICSAMAFDLDDPEAKPKLGVIDGGKMDG